MGHNGRSLLGVVLATSALLVAAVVWADDLFGPGDIAILQRFGLALLLEPCIIFVEYLVFLHVLKLQRSVALGTSLLANLASFAAGRLAAGVALGWPRPAKEALGIALLLCIEVPIVYGLNFRSVPRRLLFWTAVFTNLGTFIVARGIILGLAPG